MSKKHSAGPKVKATRKPRYQFELYREEPQPDHRPLSERDDKSEPQFRMRFRSLVNGKIIWATTEGYDTRAGVRAAYRSLMTAMAERHSFVDMTVGGKK